TFDAHWKRIMDSTGIVKKTILRGEEVAGHISCYPQEGELEVTYWLGKKHWGQGIATQALKKPLPEITHRPLFARAAKDNIRSIRVLQKCDFKIIDENKDFAQGRGEETEEYIFRLDGESNDQNTSPGAGFGPESRLTCCSVLRQTASMEAEKRLQLAV